MEIRCRRIGESDLSQIADLLARGFPVRKRNYWVTGLARLSARGAIRDYPKYGYLIEKDRTIAGVMLTIFSEYGRGAASHIRCNLSSWHVSPDLKAYAPMMVSAAIRHKDVTYLNVSPAPHTRPIIEAQGFLRFCEGQVIAVPIISRLVEKARVLRFDPAHECASALSIEERELMMDHAKQGCVVLMCAYKEEVYPFIFIPRTRLRGKIPCLHLAFCRRIEDFVRFAGPLGRGLLRFGQCFIVIDSNGPVKGLPGRYFSGLGPKYFKGPTQPALGDLSYTEGVYFH